MALPPRLYRHIVDRVANDISDTCWQWPGAINGRERPVVTFNYKTRYAYQVAYVLRYGPVPDGLELHHTCWDTTCWNPRHVQPTNRQENALAGPVRSESVCPEGHPMTGDNVQVYERRSRPRSDGSFGTFRRCRECHNLRYREGTLV